MTQTAQNIELYAGDDKEITITISDEDGNALDISGLVAAQWVLKRSPTDANELLSKTLGSGLVVTSASEGILTLTLNAADTQAFRQGAYYHECRIKNSSNKIGTVLIGSFTIYPTEEF